MIPAFLRSLAALVRQLITNGKAVHVTEQTAKELELLAGFEWEQCTAVVETEGYKAQRAAEMAGAPLAREIEGWQRKKTMPADLALGWLLASKLTADGEGYDERGEYITQEDCSRAAACAELVYLCCGFGWEERDPEKTDTWAQHTVYAHRGTREGARAACSFMWSELTKRLEANNPNLRSEEILAQTYRRELEAMR